MHGPVELSGFELRLGYPAAASLSSPSRLKKSRSLQFYKTCCNNKHYSRPKLTRHIPTHDCRLTQARYIHATTGSRPDRTAYSFTRSLNTSSSSRRPPAGRASQSPPPTAGSDAGASSGLPPPRSRCCRPSTRGCSLGPSMYRSGSRRLLAGRARTADSR